MITLPSFRSALVAAALVLSAATLTAQTPPATADATRREALHAAGITVPLVLHPVRLLGRPSADVAAAIGLVLENRGMSALDTAASATPFEPPTDTKWDDVPALFAAYVARLGGAVGEQHHLYAEFVGTPKTGPEEVRFVVADGTGHVVLVDRQTPADADFQRTAKKDPDPLGCATLVGDRLFALANWTKGRPVRDGKFAKGWKERSGVPDPKELAAMRTRTSALRGDLAKARIAVLPTLANGAHDVESATRLATAIAKELGCSCTAVAEGAKLAVEASSNEQKRLWDLARAAKEAVTKAPIANADHVLVADFGVDAEGKHCFLHVVLVTAAGEFVIADFQNDQSRAVAKAMPKTLADAETLLVARLGRLLK